MPKKMLKNLIVILSRLSKFLSLYAIICQKFKIRKRKWQINLNFKLRSMTF